MRILFISSEVEGKPTSYVEEQGESLRKLGLEVKYFLVYRKGIVGYLKSFKKLCFEIKKYKPNVIHAHYGLCGLLANLQRKVPVVTTYHGSDINIPKIRILSRISIFLSRYNIFVSAKQIEIIKPKKKFSILPCGININLFFPIEKAKARAKMNLPLNKNLILFSNYFSTYVKNAPLAIEATKRIPNSQLIELKGYTKEEVCLLMNASDVCLMTSFIEGSPLFIKEAIACNRPIVSTNVGDVAELLSGIDGCFICSYEIEDVVKKLNFAIQYKEINAREKVFYYNEDKIAKSINEIYLLVAYGNK